MMARNKTVVSFSIDSVLAKQLDDVADAKGMSRSALVEKYIEDGLKEEEVWVRLAKNPVVLQSVMQAFLQPDVAKEVMKAVQDEVKPEEVVKFQQGVKLMDNYSEEFRKSLPPDVAAKNAVKKAVRANKAASKRAKGSKAKRATE